MSDKTNRPDAPITPSMIEDKAAERRKQREMERGKIVIADDGKTSKPLDKTQREKK